MRCGAPVTPLSRSVQRTTLRFSAQSRFFAQAQPHHAAARLSPCVLAVFCCRLSVPPISRRTAELPQRRRFHAVSPVSPAYHALPTTRCPLVPDFMKCPARITAMFRSSCNSAAYCRIKQPPLHSSRDPAVLRVTRVVSVPARRGKGYFRSHYSELRC